MLGEWRLKAKCFNDAAIQDQLKHVRSGYGYDPFFPEARGGQVANAEERASTWAKKYCSDCPVRLSCLAEAMKTLDLPIVEQYQGVWGGMTKRSRVRIQKKQKEQLRRISERLKALSPDSEDPIAS